MNSNPANALATIAKRKSTTKPTIGILLMFISLACVAAGVNDDLVADQLVKDGVESAALKTDIDLLLALDMATLTVMGTPKGFPPQLVLDVLDAGKASLIHRKQERRYYLARAWRKP